ncbi:MAG: flagellar biosynthetic protein FliO [Candidatus Eisenbacteria sp.]|nr:flagellar biosynthetic protein FliO [Candidatus Eisenbacteria bacterium]
MKRLLVLLLPAICLAVILFCWGGLHGSAAADPTAEPGRYEGGEIEISGLALRVALALALILLLIVGAVYTLRLIGGRGGVEARGAVEVLDRCYLAPKRALYTVRMGERVVVVGVTEASITPVVELSLEESSEMYPEGPASPARPGGFQNILKSLATKVVRPRV